MPARADLGGGDVRFFKTGTYSGRAQSLTTPIGVSAPDL
jgi:hypothetical protein